MAEMSGITSDAGGRQSVARSFSTLLAGAAPIVSMPVPVPVPSTEDASGAPDTDPLTRHNSQQLNRSRVQENRRLVAQQMLEEMLPVLGCAVILVPLLLFLTVFVASVAMYLLGWWVLLHFTSRPCDMPLKWWLIVMLLLPSAQCVLNLRQQGNTRLKRLQAFLLPLVLVAGVWMVMGSGTCRATNPELYEYAKMYVTYQAIILLIMFCTHFFMHCGFVTLVFWLHRNGMLDSGPGPSHAARPGLIEDLQTVLFSDDLFDDEDAGSDCGTRDPPECSICQEEFKDGEVIKRTPCKHHFHEQCLGEWLESYARTCPLCRSDLEEAVGPPNGSAA